MQISSRSNEISPHLLGWLLPKQNQNQKKIRVGDEVEKLELLCTVGGDVEWCSRYGKQYGGSPKCSRYVPAILLLSRIHNSFLLPDISLCIN